LSRCSALAPALPRRHGRAQDEQDVGRPLREAPQVDPVVTAAAVRVRAGDYLGGADAADPAVSPVYASLACRRC